MSTNDTEPPTYRTQLALAANVNGEVTTRSPGAEAGGGRRRMEGGGAARERHRVAGLDSSGQRVLELGDVGALRQPVALQHGHDRGDVVVVDRLATVGDHGRMRASSSVPSQRSLTSLEKTNPSSSGFPSVHRGCSAHQGCSGSTT